MVASTLERQAEALPAQRLFLLSCIALTVTAMTFSIRAGMLGTLGQEFALTARQAGITAAMAGFGFPVATVLGGLIYNRVGPKTIMIIAFLGHLLGLGLTIISGGFWGLAISTFFIGFANGAVEAACNPMITKMYDDNKTTMLNKFHVWFPGGLAIGALAAFAIQKMFGGSGRPTWQLEIAIMIVPTLIYGWMVFTTKFPDIVSDKTDETDTMHNLKSMFSPLFIVIALIMTVTAATELGTNQWVGSLLEASGAVPLVVLALVSVIMALGRYFAGPLVHRLNPIGVLLMSAILTSIGIFLLSVATGGVTYLAAIVFAVGICYFWPTMIGVIAEYKPETGALGMSVVGGMGMVGFTIWTPVIGGWIDAARSKALAAGLSDADVTLQAGQETLGQILYLPLGLIVVFGILFFMRKTFTTEVAND
ncbi:MFS transporter [Litorimonas sp. WD9-15]|uniref:MFS transporter n=1 Tax=Litorimonas sp. WD9-15 TaxID=3418716 RepID=UPI003CFEB463